MNWVDPWGLRTFYDELTPNFLNDLRKNNPVEHSLFVQYAKGVNTDLWTSDIRYREMAWKKFDPYARSGAANMFSEGCQDTFSSINGPESWLSETLGGLLGLVIGIHSDAGTVNSAGSLIELTGEATNIMVNGPAVVNENTWTEAFGPYTPGLQ